ncbi:MAG: GNAT family N-acetyltransferase [Burkholderiaceae bacterium]|nr:GNAT family N-acetyltransferase [Burkholderiaceae bacterium]
MRRLRLTPRIDLEVFFRAEPALRHPSGGLPDEAAIAVLRARLQHCPSIGFEMDGQAIGGLILEGHEAFIAVLPNAHGHWALLLKPALDWLFGLRAAVLARVAVDNHSSIALMERHGWRRLRADASTISYLMVPLSGTRKTAYRFREDAAARRPPAASAG